MWLDIDSSLQTDDSKWLDSSRDSTRPSHDSDSTRKNFRWLWLDSNSRGLWLWFDKNDSGTSLHLLDMQRHKITYCSAEPSCKCAEKSDVSQQRHNAVHHSHKQIFLLFVFCENSLPQKGFCPQESFVFCKVLSLLSLQHFRVDKRLLFVIYIVVAYFISFKPEWKSSYKFL